MYSFAPTTPISPRQQLHLYKQVPNLNETMFIQLQVMSLHWIALFSFQVPLFYIEIVFFSLTGLITQLAPN